MKTPKYVLAGDQIPPEFLTAAGFNRLLGTIEELRAVLAPLLERPIVSQGVPAANVCVSCHAESEHDEPWHDRDCPVLRKDELLGPG